MAEMNKYLNEQNERKRWRWRQWRRRLHRGGDGGADEVWKVLVVGDVLVLRRWGSRLCLLKSVSKAMAIMAATVKTMMAATVMTTAMMTATNSPS
ncbi:uncharacterized protein G2W53_017755 [Senna tora]|uniref:Uncharacterized protein n=1 Tax=Senna tora TaxID=362788 RepID=A0A834TTP1_9FABA|nr:uncharacterized protein G2W53_017755 [Senna tora]